eukprot:PITA_13323
MAVTPRASCLALLSFKLQPHVHKVGGSVPTNQFSGHRKDIRIQCMGKPELKSSDAPQSPPLAPKFRDIFEFSGPAPETINGRLAMLGFVSVVAVEAATGNDRFSQVNNGGVLCFLVTASVLTAASLIPMLKGVTRESRSEALMSSDAETWNGRLAMVGLMALALTEFLKGGPLV